MDLFGLLAFFGGLAMFLYGISLLGSSLEKASGGRLERTLERLTSNVFSGVAFGALVTAAIQSSSATTVIVVGLVNARVLKLRGAIGVIMGANVGTTVTAHILRLSDISSDNFILRMLNPDTLAPLAAIIGILLFMSGKRDQTRNVGLLLIGFSILFTGMGMMEDAVRPLREVEWFTNLFATFENPILGVLVGALVTAVIQSSSASVGILQALSSAGFVNYSMAFPIIMGQNIGTCVTPILASFGASKNAKRAACVHVSFNILGTLIFLAGCYALQYTIGFPFWDDPIDKGGIANFHTLFNVVTTVMFMPFISLLEKIACTIVKDKPGDQDKTADLVLLDERLMRSPGLAIEHAQNAILQMAHLSRENLLFAHQMVDGYDQKMMERLMENEEVVDKLQDRVENYLVKLAEHELTDAESKHLSELLQICGEFERMADHAENIAECGQKIFMDNAKLSKRAVEELHTIEAAVIEIFDLAILAYAKNDNEAAENIEPLEEVIDQLEQALRKKHIERLRRAKCTLDAAFPYVEILSNLERISDHCSNVGLAVLSFGSETNRLPGDRHEYAKMLLEEGQGAFREKYKNYSEYYFSRLQKESKEERVELKPAKDQRKQKEKKK